jgi:hypothetical protein
VARTAVSRRGDLRRDRNQLRHLFSCCDTSGTLPLRPRRQRDPHRPARGDGGGVARLPAGSHPGSAVWIPRPRPVRPRPGAVVQSQQAPRRSLRVRHRRRHRLGPGRLRVRIRRPRHPQRRRQRSVRPPLGGRVPVLRLGRRPPTPHPSARDDPLRGARQGVHQEPPRRARGTAGHLRRTGASHGHRPSGGPGCQRRRVAAGAPVRAPLTPRRTRPAQLLGLRQHRVLRPPR